MLRKICTTCLSKKPVNGFYKHRLGKFGVGTTCKPCARQMGRVKYQNDPVAGAANSARWRKTNPDKAIAANTKWRKENPKRAAEATAAWLIANPLRAAVTRSLRHQANAARNSAKGAAWRQANPGRQAALSAAWQKANPNKVAANSRKRRALKANAEGSHTDEDVQQILIMQSGRCNACSCQLFVYHVDHVHPLNKGGSDNPNNLQILCPTCNCKKGVKLNWRAAA